MSIKNTRGTPLTIVDLACGTGAVTRLIAEEVARQGRQAHILGVDLSAEALRLAQQTMAGMGAGVRAEFIQGDADDLFPLVHNADAAFFCNAFHLLAEKRAAFERLAACSPAIAPSTRERVKKQLYASLACDTPRGWPAAPGAS